MMNDRSPGNPTSALRGVWSLYGAAFAMAINLSVLWTAMPFIIRNIGGTEEHVGFVWAANMTGYVICLLVAAILLGHVNPRWTTRVSSVVMLLATGAIAIVVYRAVASDQAGSVALVWGVIGAGALAGAAMSLFWPFLMTWVSADYEGVFLNRRLGAYNGAWSSAAIMGPLIGGALVDINTLSPVLLGVICLAVCFLLLCLTHDGSAGTARSVGGSPVEEVALDQTLLRRLKWMARISLFCSWVCLGVSRSQFALLFTRMGYTETQFGTIVTVFAICNFLVLTGAGRFGFWHSRPVFLIVAQLVLGVGLLLLIFGRTLSAFVPAFVIMGSGFGFAYSSHLYYGACGSKKRSVQMAIHEVTISLGVIVGSGTGGYLAGNLGVYVPYWFAIGVLILGLVAQGIVWIAMRGAPRAEAA